MASPATHSLAAAEGIVLGIVVGAVLQKQNYPIDHGWCYVGGFCASALFIALFNLFVFFRVAALFLATPFLAYYVGYTAGQMLGYPVGLLAGAVVVVGSIWLHVIALMDG